ncbi:hypothetical protein [Singulisphaera acidiphila]|uniref:hypothetical protein n=1 Tax=Singulisphaera acidiphila TaxID=466153 RepID=UPI00137867AF|nr:hypothetical protein [Singulisphaera acidiphila]
MRINSISRTAIIITTCSATICLPVAIASVATSLSVNRVIVPVGQSQRFTVKYDVTKDGFPASHDWFKIEPIHSTLTQLGPASDDVFFNWSYPGARTVGCYVTYMPDPGAPPNNIVTTAVNVLPPDTETFQPFGIGAPVALGIANHTIISSVWTCGSEWVIMDASTTAEEKLFYEQGGVVPADDFVDWAPGTPGTWNFTIDILQDSKSYDQNAAQFATYGPNQFIMSYWQKNRLKYLREDGSWGYAEGPSRHWGRQKVTNPNDPTGLYWELVDLGHLGTPAPAGF